MVLVAVSKYPNSGVLVWTTTSSLLTEENVLDNSRCNSFNRASSRDLKKAGRLKVSELNLVRQVYTRTGIIKSLNRSSHCRANLLG